MPFIDSAFGFFERKGGDPRELFTFQRGVEVWRHTSANKTQPVVYGAATLEYSPAMITRERIERSQETGAIKTHVKVSRIVPVAAALQATRMFPMKLGIHKLQEHPDTAPILLAYGDVAAVTQNEGWVEFDLVTGDLALSQPFPRPLLERRCQWNLGDANCGVRLALFSHATTIVAVERSSVIVDSVATVEVPVLDPDTGEPTGDTTTEDVAANYYDAGRMELESGEQLFIAKRSGTTFEIYGPMADGVAPGDPVTLIAGDDKSIGTCFTKFNNVHEHMGFPFLPVNDPFQSGF